MSAVKGVARPLLERLDARLGGPARRRVIALLALVLALDAADKATVGAVAADLQQHLGITNLQLGVLASASLGVAGVATIGAGLLTDRIDRTRLLTVSIVVWTAAMVAAGASTSFTMLLLSRLGLGVVAATAGPAIASLVGDWFPARDRGQIYGYVLTGEIIGAGFGFVVAGEATALLSWRWGFLALVPPGLAVAGALLRWLPEPARGGKSRLAEGAETLEDHDTGADDDGDPGLTLAQQAASDADLDPHDDLVLEEDPKEMPLRRAVRYVLELDTNRILIIASALGWFFFAGVRTFAVVFLRGHFDVGQSVATALLTAIGVGGLIGVLIGGRLSDRFIRKGRLNSRVLVAVVGFGVTPLLLAPGIYSSVLWISIPLLCAGTATLGAANPPVDAGRLDVMHHRMWGRAEGVRTLTRSWAEAGAPIIFGAVSQLLSPSGSGSPFAAQGAAHTNQGPDAAAEGIQYAFLIMLVPVLAGALIGLRALRTYPRDVATAAASEERTDDA